MLNDKDTPVWSSDGCKPEEAEPNVVTLEPGEPVLAGDRQWDGAPTCTTSSLPAGTYCLQAVLAGKRSDPVTFELEE